jgi:transposase
MPKTFRPYDLDQRLLLPPDLRDWLPTGHLALFISDVVDEMDLSAILRSYEDGDGRGQPPYHPALMVKLLLYAYCVGRPSSRKIERATYEEVAFRLLAADQHPDHDSLAEFRKRHLPALAGLFGNVLELCQRAGLVTLGHVAIDGTKIKANASKHKAMSYARMEDAERRLAAEVQRWLEQAAEIDAAEDAQYGRGRRGDELPPELATREKRLAAIRAAKAALEAEAKERARQQAEEARTKNAARDARPANRKGLKAHEPDPEQTRPAPSAQRNFTDPESRIMKDGADGSFVQAYNAQAAVDATAQIIVACHVTARPTDVAEFGPLLDTAVRNLGAAPQVVTADAGYFSEANVVAAEAHGADAYILPDRHMHSATPATSRPHPSRLGPVSQRMRDKLGTPAGEALYRRRKAVVEPVFGQIKELRHFRRFSFRGLQRVSGEWVLICLTHNLLKLFRARGLTPQPTT